MASQINALHARNNLIEDTLDNIVKHATKPFPVSFIFDTGGFINLFEHSSILLPTEPIAAEYLTTSKVIDELQLRKNYKILHRIYEMQQLVRDVEKMHLEIVNYEPTKRDQDVLYYGLKKGSYDGNRRLGEADISLLALAGDLKSEIYPIIVSPDTDIPNIITGIKTKMIGYLPPSTFLELYEQNYERERK